MIHLLHELPQAGARRDADAPALTHLDRTISYGALLDLIDRVAAGLIDLGIARGERVAFFLDKRMESVASAFGASNAGAVFVPINPLLKADQVAHILRDCNVRVLITSGGRLDVIAPVLNECRDLRHVVLTDGECKGDLFPHVDYWSSLIAGGHRRRHRIIDTDMAAILYTSGSTGRPKGVILSHRNLVAGAQSVASYLENEATDVILSALPLSFDAGFSQLTTGFLVGARVVLLNYLLPQDIVNAIAHERVTGLTGVPPLWIQLANLAWSSDRLASLRYAANTGGRMPLETLRTLRDRLPRTRFFLMYGLTEAFRSTYLPPSEIDRRPDSIGKAVPNAEILVLAANGSECAANEPGELVHRGALVGMGYWNDPGKTAERYKPLPPGIAGREMGSTLPEIAVFSGDTVKMDEDGFLYFVGRNDEMIKTSGYRVSPTEIEEAVYATKLVGEAVAFGVSDPALGQVITLVVAAAPGSAVDIDLLLAECRKRLPTYMVPARVHVYAESLPRNANGKLDRTRLSMEYRQPIGSRVCQ